MEEEIKQKHKKETEITGIDWKIIRTLQDLDTVPQDEIYDESVSASDFTLSLMPGLTNEEIEDALFWKDYVRGVILITGAVGQGKGMLAHMIAFKFKRYYRYVRKDNPNIWCPLKVVSDSRPRKLFGRVIPFSEAFITEQMSRMYEVATMRVETYKDSAEDILMDRLKPHVAEDGRWISSRGEVLFQRSVWILDEFGSKYMNRREPNAPIHRLLLFDVFQEWRHIECVILGLTQEIDDLDPRCFPKVTAEMNCTRAIVYDKHDNLVPDALMFKVKIRPLKYISSLGELEYSGSPIELELDGAAPRDCLGGKAWKDLYVSNQPIGIKAPNSMRKKYQ